jgi:EamA domain-containing membrane protein RarD
MKDFVDTWIKTVNWKIGKINVLPTLFGLVMAFLDILMMSLAKLVKNKTISYSVALPLATTIYALEPYIFFKSLNYESMVVMNLLWDLTSDIMVTLVGIFWFGESIKGLRIFAFLFAIISIGLFAYTEE